MKGDSRAALFASHLVGNETSISLMTVAELIQWARVCRWSVRRTADLERHILRHHTILTIDIATCHLWAEIRANAYHRGHSLSPQDAWIAATALQYKIPLLTHNQKDYQGIDGLSLVGA
jgi:predicted nucleic acid-binding protein